MFRRDFTDDRSIFSQRMLLHAPKYAIGAVVLYHGDQLSFVRNVERIKAQQLTSALHRLAYWDRFLNKVHSDARTAGNLIQSRRNSAPGWIAKTANRTGGICAIPICGRLGSAIQHRSN